MAIHRLGLVSVRIIRIKGTVCNWMNFKRFALASNIVYVRRFQMKNSAIWLICDIVKCIIPKIRLILSKFRCMEKNNTYPQREITMRIKIHILQ